MLTYLPVRDYLFIFFTPEFSSADKSTSRPKICGNSNTRSISFFKVDSEELNWNDARSLCSAKNSTLPVTCNQYEQDAFKNYLKANVITSDVWTSGRKTRFNVWTWVNGQSFISKSKMSTFVLFFSIGAMLLVNRVFSIVY